MFPNDPLQRQEVHLVVAEPHHLKATAAQKCISLTVILGLLGCVMDQAIELDHQAQVGTDEVNDEPFDDLLPAEMVSAHRISPEDLPRKAFSKRRLTSKPPSDLDPRRCVVSWTQEAVLWFIAHGH